MRRRIIIVYGIMFFSGFIAALPVARLSDPRFSPASFRPGERVTVVAKVAAQGGEPKAFALTAGAGLREPGAAEDPELQAASLAKGPGGWTLTLVFRPWSPGPGTIPSMLVAGTSFPALRYETASVLGPGDRDLVGPRAQLEPPGTALYLYGFLGLLALLALAIAAATLWVLPGARALLARWKAKEAWKAFERTIDWLERDSGAADAAAFYAILARATRLYLARRLLDEAEALTPRELAALAPERFPDPVFREELVSLLAETDRGRFGSPGRGEGGTGEGEGGTGEGGTGEGEGGTGEVEGRTGEGGGRTGVVEGGATGGDAGSGASGEGGHARAERLRSAARRARNLGRVAEEYLDARA